MNLNLNESLLILNPTLPSQVQDLILNLTETHPEKNPKVWILSSGTSAQSQTSFKLMALSQRAMIASAQAVNLHLNVNSIDRWLNVLPLFHVGGLGVLYRAHLANCESINHWHPSYKWDPIEFTKAIAVNNITLSSLVPTQVYDLVKSNLTAPVNLRAIIVGGAKLNEDLYHQARRLGWPLLPSFGMTESCSQIATALLADVQNNTESTSFPPLTLLDHIEIKSTKSNRLQIKSPSIFDGYYAILDGHASAWVNPVDANGWYETQDCGEIAGRTLKVFSRIDDVIKIAGENVNLASLRNLLSSLVAKTQDGIDCTLISIPHHRKGNQIALVGNGTIARLQLLKSQFNELVLPFERIELLCPSIELPRSPLGKINHQLLSQSISRNNSDLK